LTELKRDLGLTYVYITHDLASARFFCDRIAIMYLGKIVETGPVAEIFDNPRHPYTKALLSAVPDPDPSHGMARDLPRGEVPDAANPPPGCPFHPRCPVAVPNAGWELRDVRMVLEQRWTKVSPEQFAAESRLVGDAERFDAREHAPGVGVLRPADGTAEEVLALLEDERAANPDEPLWQGVRAMASTGREVRIEFVERAVPQLLPVEGTQVQVACHRFHDPTPAAT
jgi:peptide/nickel transport system ATP-binding protein